MDWLVNYDYFFDIQCNFLFLFFFLISNRKNAQSVAFAMYVEEKDIEYVFVRLSKGMNGDQGTVRNNAFPNVPKKNHHSQGIIIPSHSFSFFFFCRKLKNKIIPY